jgi:hypothetical protein
MVTALAQQASDEAAPAVLAVLDTTPRVPSVATAASAATDLLHRLRVYVERVVAAEARTSRIRIFTWAILFLFVGLVCLVIWVGIAADDE